MKSQMGLVAAMSQKVGELDVTMLASNQNLTKQIAVLDAGRKKWRDETKLLRKKLEQTADARITMEKVKQQPSKIVLA